MLPATPISYLCRNCQSFNYLSYRGSGNSFGSKLYSDGKLVGPMMPDTETRVGKCMHCKKVDWLPDIHFEGYSILENNIRFSKPVKLYDCLKLLKESEYLSTEQEFYLRHKILWLFNDRVRNGKKLFAFKNDESKFLENVDGLIKLLLNASESEMESFNLDDNEGVLLAELYRYKGDFKKAMEIMDENSVMAGLIYQDFMEACKNKNQQVIQVAKDFMFE